MNHHVTRLAGNSQLTLACQLAILVGLLAIGTQRFATLRRAKHDLPRLRATPVRVRPEYDQPLVVSDRQLSRVLRKLTLPNRGAETNINHVDHALRFWGVEAVFDDPQLMSGESMRRLLVDHQRFAEVFGADQPALLLPEGTGVRVRTQEGRSTSSHVDHTLASLAEVGTPLAFPINTPLGQTSFGQVLRQSIRDFSMNQIEYEWSAVAYALFFSSGSSWTTSEGQKMDFDRLAKRIMREEMPRGVCYGNHRLFTLVTFLRVDQLDAANPMLSHAVRRQIGEYLHGMTGKLVRHQHPDGYWTTDWPNAADEDPLEDEGDDVSRRILVTGHALEWWALAPAELHPPRHVLVSAGQWLVRAIDDLTDDQTKEYYTFLTHAGRALALWRGRYPADVDLSLDSL